MKLQEHTKAKMRSHAKAVLQHKFFKFLIVGGISTIINYGIFYILFATMHIGYMVASAIGYIIGVCVGYLWNKAWTFGHTDKHSFTLVSKYLVVYGFTLILGLFFLFILVDVAHLNPLFAQFLTLILTTVSNYVLLQKFVFMK